jgi:uncharacterized protein (TIGR02391 family)
MATLRKRGVLSACIEQLEILAPPIAWVAADQYQFHAEIERVSGHLFRDGHYKQAALEAYIRVIEEVQRRSGLDLDGDNLMNEAFGCAGGRVPVLKLNALSHPSEIDEQQGFMFLFKGVVGLRNPKAHSNKLFSDRQTQYPRWFSRPGTGYCVRPCRKRPNPGEAIQQCYFL